jgi:hypothetical protein
MAVVELQTSVPVPSLGTCPGAAVMVEFCEALLSSMLVGRGGTEVGAASLLWDPYDGTCFSSSYLTTGHEQSPGTASENSFAGSALNC